MIEVLGLYKENATLQGVAEHISLHFPREKNVLQGKKVKTSNISGTMPQVFFNLSPSVLEIMAIKYHY